jgi:peptidoglycan/xylan/chitin deacetylase (PgdA/CDA1 family)
MAKKRTQCFMRFPGGLARALTLSYDDGVQQDRRLIEILNKHGIKATFNLNSGLYAPEDVVYPPHKAHRRLRESEILEVYGNSGHEVAVHTLTHPRLPELDDAEVIRQVETDRQNLSALVGYEVIGMAYPCGGVNNDDRVAALIRENTGVKYARTITSVDSFDLQDNLYRFNPNVHDVFEGDRLMELGRRFIESNPDKPQVLYVWGHSYEMDFKEDNWAKLEEFFKLVSGRNDVFYGTNKEVLLG